MNTVLIKLAKLQQAWLKSSLNIPCVKYMVSKIVLYFQTSDSAAPAKSEPNTPRHRKENSAEQEKVVADQEKVEKQEDFADFSRFESFVEAQEGEGTRGSSTRPGIHRRSFSLDHSHVRV